jgi:hypothetical protein
VAILLYILLVLLVMALWAEGMRNVARMYQFPFGAAAVFGGFIVPPLLGLLRAGGLPLWAVERFLFMCLLCLLMCWLGDACARKPPPHGFAPRVYDGQRWLLAATLLVVAGGVAYLKNRFLFQMEFDISTGLIVAISFFVVLLRYGFIMSVLYFLHTGSRYALLLTGMAALYYLDRIVLFGRRLETIELLFVLTGSVWLVERKAAPRVIVMGGIVLMTLLLFSAGAYRGIAVSRTGERDWSRLRELNVIREFANVNYEGSSETLSGIYLMAATAADKAFDFGLVHWNLFVFNYVPAQLVGADAKESLYLALPEAAGIAERKYGFTPSNGTTVTGMVDCYSSFWYLGCLKFFVIAYVMQRLYRHALHGGVVAQAVYLFMMTNALHAITHRTQWFVSPWVHMLFCWAPFFYISIDRTPVAWSVGHPAWPLGSYGAE